MIRTKILHIWNTAGVASTIAKFMDRFFPTESWVITRSKFDPYGLLTYGETLGGGSKIFALRALGRARKYDLIHVHALDKIVPHLKRLYRKKPVVMHYHGSKIRKIWNKKRQYWKKADLILVSTSDLLDGAPPGVEWQPNPVDTDLFYSKASKRRSNYAFHIAHGANDLAQELAAKYGLKLKIHNREDEPIQYKELGDVLSSYEYYIDVKRSVSIGARGELVQVMSKTGLEALACGCKVIHWDGKIHEGLPPKHHPKNVVSNLWKYYQGIFNE